MVESYTRTTVSEAVLSVGPTTTVVETFTYNEAGTLLSKSFESDETGDGVVDVTCRTDNTLNENGQIVESVIRDDWHGDGIVDTMSVSKFTYNDAGLVTTRAFAFGCPGPDGMPGGGFVQDSSYNEQRQIVRDLFTYDNNSDGVPDLVVAIQYGYQDGYLAWEYRDIGADGSVELHNDFVVA